ncbi:hypothetical protein [Streptomyces sp. NPDC051214]|uniref:hypothetical protein n=1 Tax=Streptomyces sp. NPDC051214 TaxID=3155282 RepID=UPI00344997F8
MSGAPPAARGPWLLLACALALAVCGYLLLDGGKITTLSDAPANSAPRPQESPQPQPPQQLSPGTPTPHPSVFSTPPPTAPPPPPRGEGRAADRQVQHLLENAWPADLPTAQERQLREKGARLLYADATGVGRDRFPDVFGRHTSRQVTPAFSRFRVQAAIARQDPDSSTSGRAVVHLVWAAADRGGTYIEGRISDLSFHQAKEGAPWTALPLNPS